MAFKIADFRDLIRILEEKPEWRGELRRLLLTDELLALPALVRELAEAQKKAEERLMRLELAVEGLTKEVDRLAQIQGQMADDLAKIKGSELERRYREKAPLI